MQAKDPTAWVHPDVEDNYDIGHKLGRGAYGVVWRAKDRTTGKKVATIPAALLRILKGPTCHP